MVTFDAWLNTLNREDDPTARASRSLLEDPEGTVLVGSAEVDEAFHLPGKHNQKTHAHGGTHAAFASTEEHAEALKHAKEKVNNAPVPSHEQVAKARAELEKAKRGEGRAGGESRGGSAASRRKQRENLFNEFGGDKRGYVPCHGCGLKLHHHDTGPLNPHGYARLERGKIFVKCQGGGYQLTNLLPECFGCNRTRNDKQVRRENKC